MAVYNGDAFIEGQLKSISRQTVQPYELIITDDGSSDDTLGIISEFSEKCSFPVRVFRNSSRLGYRDNFIKAAYLCSGDIIAFSDQDDVWVHNKLEEQLGYFNKRDVQMVFHAYEKIDENGQPLGHMFPKMTRIIKFSRLHINPLFPIYGMSIMFRRDLLPSPRLINSRPADHNTETYLMAHDQWIPFLAGAFGEIVYIPNRLVQYRVHQGNTSGPQHERNIIDKIASLLNTNPDKKSCDYCRRISDMMRQRANYLQAFRHEGQKHFSRHALEAAIEHYEKLSYTWDQRSICYNPSQSARIRLWVYASLLLRAQYLFARRLGFGYAALAKDLMASMKLE
ncbi:glycosyltransferase [Acidithiobacillus sp. VAN18-1]|uniref:Glycosyltransferase n=2 Tax=Igneacidithiobacillus copahuensis TaxID=2724909 RepID=A0AAE2YMP9_9PROT|nr:glycosyltransferase [Igneacidithiobacillus copahuensis]